MRTLLAALALALGTAVLSYADSTVILKDGRTVVGRLIESGDTVGVATAEGLKLFNRSDVERIERDAFGRASREQLEAYFRVQRAAEQARQPAEAAALWKKYIAGCQKGNPLIEEAEKELGRWGEAVKAGKVIWSGKLVTPEERDAQKSRGSSALDKAIAELHGGRPQQAVPLLREALRCWPDHPAIWFYYALASQKTRDPNEAARCYRLLLESFPDHVPTLNNLAILECTRRQYAAGAPLILRAANLAQDVVSVNDNAYVTLLRAGEAKVQGLESDLAQLRLANLRFEATMRKQGLARWGTTWLSVDKVNEFNARNQDIDNQLNALANEIAALQNDVQTIKARIVELERQRLTAPNEYELTNGVDTNGDGMPDYFFPRDTLTKEKIELMLVDQRGQLAGKEDLINRKIAEGRKLQAGRSEPVKQLDCILLEDPGPELMVAVQQREPPALVVPSFVGPTSVGELVKAIHSGRAVIIAEDGTFLGKVTPDKTDPQSILNTSGLFGSQTSEFSLLNPKTRFTAKETDVSVTNPQAAHPPRLFYDGSLLAYVTENTNLTPRIRFDAVLAVLRGE